MRKPIVAAAMTASILTGAGAGALLFTPLSATAQSEDTGTDSSAPGTEAGPRQWMTDALASLVEAGTITQAQSDAVVEALVAARPAHGPGVFRHRMHHIALDAAAEAIGITVEELREEWTVGTSLADVAADHGVDKQVVIDALVAAAEERLDQGVENGRLTQEEADEKKADLETRITELVERPRPERPFGMRGDGPPPVDGGTES